MSQAPDTGYHPARVTIDEVFPDEGFAAMVSDRRWNGWAVPYFDEATARAVVAAQDGYIAEVGEGKAGSPEDVDRLRIIEAEDGPNPEQGDMIVEHRAGPGFDDDLYDLTAPVLIDGVKRWGIGGWNWTWVEVGPPRYPSSLWIRS